MPAGRHVIIVSLVLCAVTCAGVTPRASAGLLADASFENGINPLPDLATGYWSYGVWGADHGAEVLAENGITPLDGQYMLRSLPNSDAWSTTWQAIDLTPWASDVDAGNVVIDYSAWFNTPDIGSSMRGGIGLRFYSSQSGGLLAFPLVGAWLDSDPTTWEPLSLSAAVPPGARHLVVEIMYVTSTMGGQAGYTDDAELTLSIIPAPSGVALAVVGALLVWRNWRAWT